MASQRGARRAARGAGCLVLPRRPTSASASRRSTSSARRSIATRLARFAGLSDQDVARRGFYVSLLAWVGCVADSHEMARWFDDDTEIRAASYQVNRAGMPMLRFLVGHIAPGESPLRRGATVGPPHDRRAPGDGRGLRRSLRDHQRDRGPPRAGRARFAPRCPRPSSDGTERAAPAGPRGRADRARDARRPHRQRGRGLLAAWRRPRRRSTCSGIRRGREFDPRARRRVPGPCFDDLRRTSTRSTPGAS